MWAVARRSAPNRDFTLHLTGRAAPTDLPGGEPFTEAHLFEQRLPVWLDGDTYTLPGVRLTFAGRALHAEVWRDDDEALAAVHLALSEGVRASGLLPLHASVAERDGRCVVLMGESGAGKSTTLMRLARAGWRPVAEDFSWLDTRTLRIDGFDHALRFVPGTLERFAPELAPLVVGRDATGKDVLRYDTFAGGADRFAHLTTLATLARGERTRRDAITPRDTTIAVWSASGAPVTREARRETSANVERLLTAVRDETVRAERWTLDAHTLPDLSDATP